MKKALLIYILLLCIPNVFSQERTHIPYSIYGLGELNPKGNARNMAMGHTGIGLSSFKYLNNQNPASYHSIDSISFFFDFGLGTDIVKYKTFRDGSQRGMDMNLHNISIGFGISRNWKTSIGVAPYSTVGYKIETRENIEGTDNEYFDALITGNGGLTKLYWDHSYMLFNRLSLGVSFNFLFGNIQSSSTIGSSTSNTDIYITRTTYMHRMFADFGAQYVFPKFNDFQLILGGVFGNTHSIKTRSRFSVSETRGSVLEDEVTNTGYFDFPLYVGGGFGLTYKNSLTFSADYIFQNWSATASKSDKFKYRNTNTIRAGIEWIPFKYSYGYLGSIAYRAGLYYEESYLDIDNTTLSDRGFTFGAGLPFLQSRTTLNLTYNYGVNGTMNNNLIRERYHSIMVTLSMHDWWFLKRKID